MQVVFVEPSKHYASALKTWEEPRLKPRFGDAYHQYKHTTPFLLPHLPQFSQLTDLSKLIRGQATPSPRLIYTLYTSFSILGVILLILLTYSTSLPFVQLPNQQTIILLGFDFICLSGILASVYPSVCSQLISRKKSRHHAFPRSHHAQSESLHYHRHGHHFDCQHYASHVLHLLNKSYCAGCSGLMIGAIFAILGSIPVLIGFSFPNADSYFWAGAGFVVLGIFQHQFSLFNNSWLHLSLNILFVLGPFFLLLGLFTLNPTLVAELYLLTLILFWILTRITLSQIQHAKICQICSNSCTLHMK